VLIVDDEADIRDAYRQSMRQPEAAGNKAGLRDLQARLFNKAKGNPAARSAGRVSRPTQSR
jgi:hypothetical protein